MAVVVAAAWTDPAGTGSGAGTAGEGHHPRPGCSATTTTEEAAADPEGEDDAVGADAVADAAAATGVRGGGAWCTGPVDRGVDRLLRPALVHRAAGAWAALHLRPAAGLEAGSDGRWEEEGVHRHAADGSEEAADRFRRHPYFLEALEDRGVGGGSVVGGEGAAQHHRSLVRTLRACTDERCQSRTNPNCEWSLDRHWPILPRQRVHRVRTTCEFSI